MPSVSCCLSPCRAWREWTKPPAGKNENKTRARWAVILFVEFLPVIGVLFAEYQIRQFIQNAGEATFCPAEVFTQSVTSLTYWLACTVPQKYSLLLALSVAMLVLRWAIALAGSSLFGREPSPLISWSAAFFAFFLAAYPAPMNLNFGLDFLTNGSQNWMIFNFLLGVVLLYSFSATLLKLAQALSIPFDFERLLPWAPAAAVLLALSVYWGDQSVQMYGDLSDLARLSLALDNVFLYLWIAALLWLLYQEGNAKLSLNKSALWLGTLGAASVLFNVTAQWLYIPVAFLLGWLALIWLTQREQWAEKNNLERTFKQAVAMRAALIQRLVVSHAAEQTFAALQKRKWDAVAAGEEDFDQARKTVEKRATAVERLRKEPVKGVDRDFNRAPLGFGPKESGWANGLHGAKWSALLALPWLGMNFVSLMKETSFSRAYLLGFADSILAPFAFWLGIGFFMGYFFPYLRGVNGLEKGAHLALVLVLPNVPLRLIQYPTYENWLGFFLWALQVALTCALLGVFAFDYLTLRAEGQTERALLEIHGRFTLGGWSLGAIVALIAVASRWVADPARVLAWFNSAAQIILPVVSQADKLVK